MKKFEFQLQRLLDMREAKEMEIKNELAAVVGRQNAERVKQDELRSTIKTLGSKLREDWRAGKVDSAVALLYGRYEDQAMRAIESAEKKITALDPEVSAVRGRLVEASKEKKVVEKLKERKLEEYNLDFSRQMAKENDDINQKIYLRRWNIF
ncbi:MAG: flagellar export protein FliJ [Spirochaetia bacterium]|jgi:flagellar FliJ protein|nr:flagellar export protein FliJ [Spirochaetia bacterium]